MNLHLSSFTWSDHKEVIITTIEWVGLLLLSAALIQFQKSVQALQSYYYFSLRSMEGLYIQKLRFSTQKLSFDRLQSASITSHHCACGVMHQNIYCYLFCNTFRGRGGLWILPTLLADIAVPQCWSSTLTERSILKAVLLHVWIIKWDSFLCWWNTCPGCYSNAELSEMVHGRLGDPWVCIDLPQGTNRRKNPLFRPCTVGSWGCCSC